MTPSFSDVDLSDLPENIPPELVEEIKQTRIKTLEQQSQKLRAEAVLRDQRTIGQRYKDWAQSDTIGKELEKSFVPRGKTA